MNAVSEEKFVTVNGINICYNDNGSGDVPVIFIHGFPFDKSMWAPQVEFLKPHCRVINYDIRGYGKSSSKNDKPDMNLYADDLIAFIDKLEIKKAIVCGLSMGGYILLNAISRFPEKFKAIILADTQCIADTPEGVEKRKATIRQIEEGGLENFAKSFVGNVFSKDAVSNKINAVDQIQKVILSTNPETITGTLNALATRKETCSTLDKIKLPVLILCGSEDVVTPLKQSEFLKMNIDNSKLHVIEKAGHLSNLEQPEDFNKNIFNFVEDLILYKSI